MERARHANDRARELPIRPLAHGRPGCLYAQRAAPVGLEPAGVDLRTIAIVHAMGAPWGALPDAGSLSTPGPAYDVGRAGAVLGKGIGHV